MQKILSYVRRAADDYEMIRDGDSIAVGVSGGKDSITLLLALDALRRFYPKKYDVMGIILDIGGGDFDGLTAFFKERGIPLYLEHTNIKEVVFDIRKESNPCSLCAKLRRGALHDAALKRGAKVIALGHHRDDALETFMLSLTFEGRISCFSPVTYLDRKDIHVIRPLIYTPERDIVGFMNRGGLTAVKSPCPADGYSKRHDMKQIIRNLEHDYPGFRNRMFTAVKSVFKGGRKENEN